MRISVHNARHDTRHTARILTVPITLLLAAGALVACGSGSTTIDPPEADGSNAPAPPAGASVETPTEDAEATSEATSDTALPPAPEPSEADDAQPDPVPADGDLDRTDIDSVWQHAVQAMIDDDDISFLEVSTPEVLAELQTEQHGYDVTWRDWDFMGGRFEQDLADTIIAGECREGFDPHQVHDPGSATHSCNLVFVTDTDGVTSESTKGVFALTQGADGTWTITGYVRQYM